MAAEAFEYLLGCPELDQETRRVLWESQRRGAGFEDALSRLQSARDADGTERLRLLNGAIMRMFLEMNDVVGRNVSFEHIQDFLLRFDAIFTLNQDTLLERKHFVDGLELRGGGRWIGWTIPGTRLIGQAQDYRVPDMTRQLIGDRIQPYFKLHGSSNFIEEDRLDASPLLVMGGNKPATIARYPLLRWYADEFARRLQTAGTRLMVIGYSFRDPHINGVIEKAVRESGLRLFIVDPLGTDIVDPVDPRAAIRPPPSPLAQALESALIGASRRSIRSTIGGDEVEYTKLMRFFE